MKREKNASWPVELFVAEQQYENSPELQAAYASFPEFLRARLDALAVPDGIRPEDID
jgi:hypothetical protein